MNRYRRIPGDITETHLTIPAERDITAIVNGLSEGLHHIKLYTTDLAENIQTIEFDIYVDNTKPTADIVLNYGNPSVYTKNIDVSVRGWDASPLLYAYVAVNGDWLESFRGEDYYLTEEQLDLVNEGSPYGQVVVGEQTILLEYVTLPQEEGVYWSPSHPSYVEGLPILVKIDAVDNLYPLLQWRMDESVLYKERYKLYTFVVDFVGNCSEVVSSSPIALLPPRGAEYPHWEFGNFRRNHRYRGPRESEKHIADIDEVINSLVAVEEQNTATADNLLRVINGTSDTPGWFNSTGRTLLSEFEKLVVSVRHIMVQRGVG